MTLRKRGPRRRLESAIIDETVQLDLSILGIRTYLGNNIIPPVVLLRKETDHANSNEFWIQDISGSSHFIPRNNFSKTSE